MPSHRPSRSRGAGPDRTAAEHAPRLFLLASSLLVAALVFDLFDFATRTGAFSLYAYWFTAGGLVVCALAVAFQLCAVPLPVRWQCVRANAFAVFARSFVFALFGASWVLRHPEADIPPVSLGLSLLGAAVVLVACWRAGEPAPEQQPCAQGEPSSSTSGMHLFENSLPPETGRVRAR
jgi:uncharacterized membrane protein